MGDPIEIAGEIQISHSEILGDLSSSSLSPLTRTLTRIPSPIFHTPILPKYLTDI